MRDLVEQAEALLKQAVRAAQRNGLLAAKKIVARDVDEAARADAGFAIGIARHASGRGAGAVVLRLAGLGLESNAVGKCPAPRFDGLQQNRLECRGAVRVFDGGIYLVEEG